MDGLNSPEELIETAKELGHPAFALTDHGTLAGTRELVIAGNKHGVKPILGLEAYISPTDRFDKRKITARDDNTSVYHHISLIANGDAGYENLSRLSEIAWEEGFYHKPRIDMELLSQYNEGIIALSGCMNGLVSKALMREDEQTAQAWAARLLETFGDRFYMELQGHNPPELNHALIRIADQHGVPLVATSDCHYARPQDRDLEEIMLILSTNPKRPKEVDYNSTKRIKNIFERLDALYPERPISFAEINVFVQDRDSITNEFIEQGIDRPELYDNTLAIAEQVGGYVVHQALDLLPRNATDPDAELESRVRDGLNRRGLESRDYTERAKHELQVIKDKNFSPYFLVMEDAVSWAHEQGILVGPGRGSAVGSLVCYALGITQIDPLKYDLLFSRFIDPSRDDWPDIDVDFQDNRRGEVKQYLQDKYGNVASIATYGYFKDKGVVRDVARAFAVPVGEVNQVLKKVEDWDDYVSSKNPEVKAFRDAYPEVRTYGDRIRGKIRTTGMHAAGVVISHSALNEVAPIETRTDTVRGGRVPVVALDKDDAADVGLIKLDFLGLKTLTQVDEALKLIEQRHGVKVDLNSIPTNDAKVLDEIDAGNVTGVFQCDAGPYRKLLGRMKIRHFEDLVASNALVRPGAWETVGDEFLKRQQNGKRIQYPHPELERYLKRSFGVIIYQEQVMQTVTTIGGFSDAEANKLRSIIGKKKDKREFDQYYDKWMRNAPDFVGREVAEQLWHDFEAHAGYSFNLSHAVAYSLISYWTMWLKVYYPHEFIVALLRTEQSRDKRMEYLIEAKRYGIVVRLPHVNESDSNFNLDGEKIVFGLTAVKGIGERAAENLIKYRPFKSYSDLLDVMREKGTGISSNIVGALNKVNAASFDDNPRNVENESNYYEYLGLPKFKSYDWPPSVLKVVTPLDEYDERKPVIVLAMVREVVRKAGWARMELVDASGSGACFMNPKKNIEEGQLYFILIGGARAERWVPAEDVFSNLEIWSDEPLIRFLADPEPVGVGEHMVLSFDNFRSKKGNLIGSTIMADYNRDLKKVMVWSNMLGKHWTELQAGGILEVRLKDLADGDYSLIDARNARK